jgi:hypothetical protein
MGSSGKGLEIAEDSRVLPFWDRDGLAFELVELFEHYEGA